MMERRIAIWFLSGLTVIVLLKWLLILAASQPVVTPPPFTAQNPTLGALPSYNDASPNWKMAGLLSVGGIPNRTTQCGATVTPSGITNPPQANDDAVKISNALAACPQDQVVLLSGTFIISDMEEILFKNRAVLRGNGACTNGSTPYCPTVIKVYDGLLPWVGGQCGFGPIAAAASWTTSSSTITMSQNNTQSLVTAGMTVYDTTNAAQIGTVSSWSSASTTLTLTASASHVSSGSTDNLVFLTACPNGGDPAISVRPPDGGNDNDFYWFGALNTPGNGCNKIGSAIGCGTQLDADAAKGDMTIQVHTTTGFTVGMWVLIDEASGASYQNDVIGTAPGPYGKVWVSPDHYNTSGAPATGRTQWPKYVAGGCPGAANCAGDFGTTQYPYDGSGTHEALNDRPTSEIHLVTAVANNSNCPGVNCTITFDDPLMIAYRVSGATTFTGSIAATTLMTSGDSCVVGVGQIVDDSSHVILDGTYITVVNSCAAGAGNYTVSRSQTVTSRTMIGGSHQAHVYWPVADGGGPSAEAFLQFVGIENITIQRPPNGGITFQNCAYCWAKNVEVVGWGSGAFNFVSSVRTQLDTVFSNNCGNSVNSGSEYPLGMKDSSTELYIVNSIIVMCGKGMVGKSGAGNVVAYNYQDKTFYDSFSGIGDYFLDMGTNGSHWAGTHHYLFEGNWADNLGNDSTHGNNVYHVYFRNWGTGLRSLFTDPSPNTGTVDDANGLGFFCPGGLPANCVANKPGPLRAAGPMAHVYWHAYVGNVLGTSGITTAGNTTSGDGTGWAYQSTTSNQEIWLSGWISDARFNSDADPNLNGVNTPQFLFKHGNYDYVNGNIADWNASFSRGLPNSYYLGIRPAFFTGAACTYPWPPVTPAGASQLPSPTGPGACPTSSGFPAKARYDAGTPFAQP